MRQRFHALHVRNRQKPGCETCLGTALPMVASRSAHHRTQPTSHAVAQLDVQLIRRSELHSWRCCLLVRCRSGLAYTRMNTVGRLVIARSSFATKQSRLRLWLTGLLRFARNDELGGRRSIDFRSGSQDEDYPWSGRSIAKCIALARLSPQPLRKASRSALMTSAWVVIMPCG